MIHSRISINAPTVRAKPSDLNNMVSFIFSYEQDLKTYGAIKIEQNGECKHLLKKRRKPSYSVVKRQRVRQVCDGEGIFSVHALPCRSFPVSSELLTTDESAFWKSLCRNSDQEEKFNISTYPGKSFYSKHGNVDGFNMHRIPSQSLLDIGGKKLTSQFLPTLVQTHHAGAVCPLGTGRQCLLSLNYLHEGAPRHWYIIPIDERPALEKTLAERNASLCLQHQQLLLDPDFLDKNHIRYYRLIQDPGQFVVLEAGTLAHSYYTGASWSETIDFALPSWLENERARIRTTFCPCNDKNPPVFEAIDVDLFRFELVERYVAKYLNYVCIDNTSTSSDDDTARFIPTATPHSSCLDLSDGSSMSSISTRNLLGQSSVRGISSPLVEYNSPSDPDQETTEDVMIIEKTGNVRNFTEQTDHHDFIQSNNARAKSADAVDVDSQSMSLEDLFDLFPMPSTSSQSAYSQTDIPMITSNTDETHIEVSSSISFHVEENGIRRRETVTPNKETTEIKTSRKTLCVSNLKRRVTKNELKRHFIGCTKIILKQHKMLPYLKYAFVVHRTCAQAEKNQKRPIIDQRWGSDCRVEFFQNAYGTSTDGNGSETSNIVVTQIPANVTEDDLRNMFVDCDSLKYCPARTTQKLRNNNSPSQGKKILQGYAFLYYSNSQRGAEVVQRNGQYFINNQSLTVSYRSKNCLIKMPEF